MKPKKVVESPKMEAKEKKMTPKAYKANEKKEGKMSTSKSRKY